MFLNKKALYWRRALTVLTTKAYDKHKGKKQMCWNIAYMLKEILENMTLYIEDETMIVGNQAS